MTTSRHGNAGIPRWRLARKARKAVWTSIWRATVQLKSTNPWETYPSIVLYRQAMLGSQNEATWFSMLALRVATLVASITSPNLSTICLSGLTLAIPDSECGSILLWRILRRTSESSLTSWTSARRRVYIAKEWPPWSNQRVARNGNEFRPRTVSIIAARITGKTTSYRLPLPSTMRMMYISSLTPTRTLTRDCKVTLMNSTWRTWTTTNGICYAWLCSRGDWTCWPLHHRKTSTKTPRKKLSSLLQEFTQVRIMTNTIQ